MIAFPSIAPTLYPGGGRIATAPLVSVNDDRADCAMYVGTCFASIMLPRTRTVVRARMYAGSSAGSVGGRILRASPAVKTMWSRRIFSLALGDGADGKRSGCVALSSRVRMFASRVDSSPRSTVVPAILVVNCSSG
ncbi:hypothetical protein CNMCM8927_007309 [Aspergillus lentulus]|uniref:Uncharacterized protein n=1 Tax=Aspergillus lentulus TaxID=293939 RepID=A0AAN5YDL1_ASPLE|nr:hypothetical protein CNMCM8927_007309 [Aspergillus lentulus]